MWFKWDSKIDNFRLHNFIRENNHVDEPFFRIKLNSEEVFTCQLCSSESFNGLSYIKAVSETTSKERHFAVGDPLIKYWQPIQDNNDLMVA